VLILCWTLPRGRFYRHHEQLITTNFFRYIEWTYDKSLNDFTITKNFVCLESQHRMRTLCGNHSQSNRNQQATSLQRSRSVPTIHPEVLHGLGNLKGNWQRGLVYGSFQNLGRSLGDGDIHRDPSMPPCFHRRCYSSVSWMRLRVMWSSVNL